MPEARFSVIKTFELMSKKQAKKKVVAPESQMRIRPKQKKRGIAKAKRNNKRPVVKP